MASLHPYAADGGHAGSAITPRHRRHRRGRALGIRSAVGARSWSAGAYRGVGAPRGTKPRRCRSRRRGPLPSSLNLWPRRLATPTRARKWSAYPSSRRRSGESTRVQGAPGRARSCTPWRRRWSCFRPTGFRWAATSRTQKSPSFAIAERAPPAAGSAPRGRECDVDGAAHPAAGPRRASRIAQSATAPSISRARCPTTTVTGLTALANSDRVRRRGCSSPT
jgi:hypothetical protein